MCLCHNHRSIHDAAPQQQSVSKQLARNTVHLPAPTKSHKTCAELSIFDALTRLLRVRDTNAMFSSSLPFLVYPSEKADLQGLGEAWCYLASRCWCCASYVARWCGSLFGRPTFASMPAPSSVMPGQATSLQQSSLRRSVVQPLFHCCFALDACLPDFVTQCL